VRDELARSDFPNTDVALHTARTEELT